MQNVAGLGAKYSGSQTENFRDKGRQVARIAVRNWL